MTTPGTKIESSILGLYSSKTNLHAISRFLPDSIHRFTPYINFGDSPQKSITGDQIRERCGQWLTSLTAEILLRGREMLSLLDSAQSLSKTRLEAWKVLQITPGTAQARPNWDQVCINVFGRPFCIWRDVFRELFNSRSQDIIKSSFVPLLLLPSKVVAPVLAEIQAQSPSVAQDKNVGKYVWSAEEEKTSASSVSDRSYGFTPAVIAIQLAFDQELQRIKSDVDHIFFVPNPSTAAGVGDSPEQDVYQIISDSLALRNALQRACVDAIFEFKGELEKMVLVFSKHANQQKHRHGQLQN